MQVSNPNNIKIYNLSAGKSLPEVRIVFRVTTILKFLEEHRVYGRLVATNHTAGLVHSFTHTHVPPGGQWHQNAYIHGWRWLQFALADHMAYPPQFLKGLYCYL